MDYVGQHRRTYPEPTIDVPDMELLMDMVSESTMEATDGCEVEPDGECSHGHPSWLVYWEMI